MIRLLLFTFFTLPALAGDDLPSVIGAWRSDAKATNAYLDKHAKLNEYQKKVFASLFGRALVTFRADGTGSIVLDARTFPTRDGGQLEWEATKADFTFKVLDATESQIVMKSDLGEELFDGYPFAILKFHDQDTYSVSLSDGIADINGREFFKRVKITNEQNPSERPTTDSEPKSEGKEELTQPEGLVATSAVGGDPPEHLLPKSLIWSETSIPVGGIEIPFRIARIAEMLTVSEIEKPLEDDRKELMSFVLKFIHEWDFVQDFKRLQRFYEPTDSFQEAEEGFSGLTRPEPDAGSRIYTHMIEREGFYYLLGVKHKENGTTQKVIGTYIWKGDRFYAVRATPEFLKREAPREQHEPGGRDAGPCSSDGETAWLKRIQGITQATGRFAPA